MHRALLTLREMPASCRPVLVTRSEKCGIVIAAYDPRATRIEVVTALVDELSIDEQNLYRAGYGCGPVGTPMPDWMFTEDRVMAYVPPALRTRKAPAVQGRDDLSPALLRSYERWAVTLISPPPPPPNARQGG